MLIEINPQNPPLRLIRKVVETLKRGGIIAYPTDTFYGIGCDIFNKKAIERVYQIKQRDRSQPFSFICSSLKNISDYAKVSNYAYKPCAGSSRDPIRLFCKAPKWSRRSC